MWLALLLAGVIEAKQPRPKALAFRLGLWKITIEQEGDDIWVVSPFGFLSAFLTSRPNSELGPDAETKAWAQQEARKKRVFVMQDTEVDFKTQGLGVGREMYLALIRHVSAQNGVLFSNNLFGPELTSHAASRAWASLRDEPGIRIESFHPDFEDPDGGAYGEPIYCGKVEEG